MCIVAIGVRSIPIKLVVLTQGAFKRKAVRTSAALRIQGGRGVSPPLFGTGMEAGAATHLLISIGLFSEVGPESCNTPPTQQ